MTETGNRFAHRLAVSKIIRFMPQRVASLIPAVTVSVISAEPVASMTSLPRLAVAVLCGMMGLLAIAGCRGSQRPELGRVHGRVTMDGQPLCRAGIAFQPKDKGRESYAVTDVNGEYELSYFRGVKGAGVGENSVRVTTQKTNDPETETVPERYNR